MTDMQLENLYFNIDTSGQGLGHDFCLSRFLLRLSSCNSLSIHQCILFIVQGYAVINIPSKLLILQL